MAAPCGKLVHGSLQQIQDRNGEHMHHSDSQYPHFREHVDLKPSLCELQRMQLAPYELPLTPKNYQQQTQHQQVADCHPQKSLNQTQKQSQPRNLTFEKQHKFSAMLIEGRDQISANLFPKKHTQQVECQQEQHQIIKFIFHSFSPIAKAIASADLQHCLHTLHNKQAENCIHSKLHTDINLSMWQRSRAQAVLTYIKIVRNLKKKKSVLINIRVMQHRQSEQLNDSTSGADQHRLYLLESLHLQLSKRVFFDIVKYNCMVAQSARLTRQHELQQLQDENQQMESRQAMLLGERKANAAMHLNQNLIRIFVGNVQRFIDKKMYSIFQVIKKMNTNTIAPSPVNSMNQHLSNPLSQNYSPQNQEIYEDESDEQLVLDVSGITSEQQQRILPILDYIRQLNYLLRQLSNSETTGRNLMNAYFIKWKKYFLRCMIAKIINDISQTPQQPYQLDSCSQFEGSDDQSYSKQNNSDYFLSPKHEYQLSQKHTNICNVDHEHQSLDGALNSLKEQKALLKFMLNQNSVRKFYHNLSEMKADRVLKQTVYAVYAQNLLRRAYKSLKVSYRMQVFDRQLESYAKEVAELQCGDQLTSQIFYNTNLVIRTFFSLKKVRVSAKLCVKVSEVGFRIGLRAIQQHLREVYRHTQKLQRFKEMRNKLLLFRYFNALKNVSSVSLSKQAILNKYKEVKDMALIQHYFSVLKLHLKIRYRQSKKIEKIRLIHNAGQFIELLESNARTNKENYSIQQSTDVAIGCLQQRIFFRRFFKFSERQKQQKRNLIRLQRIKACLHVKLMTDCLKRWRVQNLKRNSLRAVEVRFVKFRENEERRKYFQIWIERLVEKMRPKNSKNSHKLWLNKYYDQLCAIEK